MDEAAPLAVPAPGIPTQSSLGSSATSNLRPGLQHLRDGLSDGLISQEHPPGVGLGAVTDAIRCGEERVRIMGLDTPELSARCPREERLARAATARMSDLIADGVTLQPHGRDRYHRLLAVVRDRQGRDVAQVMIREGTRAPMRAAGGTGGARRQNSEAPALLKHALSDCGRG
ncbi:MAG: hypothetical protein JWR00_79 [Rubritepida sp.]|nr:hypothetical protein [Rubritepida sp.]